MQIIQWVIDNPVTAATDIERLESRLAAADRLLRDMRPHIDGLAGVDGEPFSDRIDDYFSASVTR